MGRYEQLKPELAKRFQGRPRSLYRSRRLEFAPGNTRAGRSPKINLLASYFLSSKNFWAPAVPLVTVYWPFTITGAGFALSQVTGGTRLVVERSEKPTTLVGHAKMKLVPF